MEADVNSGTLLFVLFVVLLTFAISCRKALMMINLDSCLWVTTLMSFMTVAFQLR